MPPILESDGMCFRPAKLILGNALLPARGARRGSSLNLSDLQTGNLEALSDEQFRELLAQTVHITQEDRRQNSVLYYQPVSAKAQAVHDSTAKVLAIGGGNGSSKTECLLVELVMACTGVFPYSQRHLIKQKFRGPVNCRLTVESLTTTLEPIILPKLMYWRWSGVDQPGGERGHWGWVPQDCLVDGDWQKSWSAKLRMLRLICRDPENHDKVLGESTIQCMSTDQDSTDFASGDFHICAHDEPPSLAIWRENEARTMRVDGRLLLAMTWPDDPSINVDWLYDEVYEPGRSGSDPAINWFELWTTENKNLKQEAVAAQAEKWSEEIAGVRIYGRPIRFSNRIHPEFSDHPKTWCFRCDKSIIPVPNTDLVSGAINAREVCPNCGSERIVAYCHVQEFDTAHSWPTVFLLDPHPRRDHMYLWVQISPQDDWYVVVEGKCDGDCVDTRRAVNEIEAAMGLYVPQRLTDPNMALSPTGPKRVNWIDEFAAAGLLLDLADDSSVGRQRINQMFKPDADTEQPRLFIHPRCKTTIYQLQRYSWADFSKRVDRDQKQEPKDKHSDMPTLLKYLANSDPSFRFLKSGPQIIQRPGSRRGAY